jgi:DNA-binding NarL/FixJ family response regulator
MMPIHDGLWVLRQFPKEHRTFPVIMLTNMEDDASRKTCEELGMDGYFVKKDMSLATLVEMTEKLLQKDS